MKIFNIIFVLSCLVVMTSCDPDYAVEDYFDLEELPGYVAFDTDGNGVSLANAAVSEADVSARFFVENPTGTKSEITVNYNLSGSAIYGTDYTIAGATAAGGSVKVKPNSGAVNQTNRVALPIVILTDGVVDGEKTITITLIDASNAEGNVAVGRGGKDILRVANVVITDVDM